MLSVAGDDPLRFKQARELGLSDALMYLSYRGARAEEDKKNSMKK